MKRPDLIGARLASIADPLALLAGFIEHSPVAYQIYSADGHSLLTNPAFRELFASEPPPEYNVLEDEIAEQHGLLSELKRAFEGETIHTPPIWYDPRELRKVKSEGGRRIGMRCTAFPLFDAAGTVSHVAFVFADATAELEARERTESERDLLRAIIDQSGVGILATDAAGRMQIFNPAAAEQHGVAASLAAPQLPGTLLEWAQKFAVTDAGELPLEAAGTPLGRALGGELVDGAVFRVHRPGGEARTLYGTASPLRRASGEIAGAVLITRDETERQTLARALDDSEARLRAVLDHSVAAIFMKDLEGRYLLANREVKRVLVKTDSELIGHSPYELFPRELADQLCLNEREVLARRTALSGEAHIVHPDGQVHTYLAVKFPILDAKGTLVAVGGISSDITERKRAIQALAESEARFAKIFRMSPLAITITSADDHRFLDVNEAFERFSGLSRAEVIGRTSLELGLWTDPAARDELFRLLQKGEPVRDFEAKMRTRSGEVRDTIFTAEQVELGHRVCIVVLSLDVTEHRRLEAELRQSQKMEAVGRLAGGVAHDFNNILTALTGYGSLLVEGLAPAHPLRHAAEQMQKASARATALTGQLLAFSRKQSMAPAAVDLNAVVTGTLAMLRRTIGEDIEVRTALEPALWRVRADPSQLEQVVLNLVLNARDAMPDGGVLSIATRHQDGQVMLTVRDTGIGMDAVVRARLFEPFFTTKEQGKGTGLGLSTVYGIVRQSGGQITVESARGEGAEFRILLPRLDAGKAAEPGAAASSRLPGGHETILLVEDDEAVREFVHFVLTEQGYTVLDANDGLEALRVAEGHRGTLDLLISDLVMPKLSGPEVSRRLTAVRPGIRVLHISGYAGERQFGREETPAPPFLQKPFSREVLARKVREVLDGQAGYRAT